jgi:hypothetical protein
LTDTNDLGLVSVVYDIYYTVQYRKNIIMKTTKPGTEMERKVIDNPTVLIYS